MTVLVDTEAVATEIWEAKHNADQEAAATQVKNLTESKPLSEAKPVEGSKGRYRIALIRAGWGSSGYYPAEVLERDGPKIWPAGTQQYLNHPTVTEQVEQPERRVQDWASELVTDPVWDPATQELVAEVEVYPQWRDLLNPTFAKKVGLSIRACGEAQHGEAEGREGPIITRLTEGISVDWVTKAGAGGRVLQLIESARREGAEARQLAEARNIGGWLESRLHCTFTEITDGMYGDGRLTRDERIGLSSAIGDALDAFVKRVEADYPQLYQRDLYDGPPEPGEAPAVMAETITPAPPVKPTQEGAPMTVTTTSTGTTTGAPPQGGATTQLSEAERLLAENTKLKQELAEAQLTIAKHGDNDRELADTQTKLDESRKENLRLKANDAARAKALETLAESTLPKAAHAEVVAAVTGDHVPLNDDGALDEAALVTDIRAAIEKQRRYLAAFAEESGLGTVRGLGSSGRGDEVTDADVTESLKGVFGRIGLDEQLADIAAKGR